MVPGRSWKERAGVSNQEITAILHHTINPCGQRRQMSAQPMRELINKWFEVFLEVVEVFILLVSLLRWDGEVINKEQGDQKVIRLLRS